MDQDEMRRLLERVAAGETTVDDALLSIRREPLEDLDLGFAKLDMHRAVRQGAAEVVYGEGKTAEQIASIVRALLDAGQPSVLVTRMDAAKAQVVAGVAPLDYDPVSRVGLAGKPSVPNGRGYVAVVSGGTSDQPVAEEAARTAEALGSRVERVYDVGVAGVHRLLAHSKTIMGASAVVAVAGMEGALASVVGGLADCPVVAVPTSVGYGASFGGVAALLSMLNSCASGVSVVNIDNGFGAGFIAARIDHIGMHGEACTSPSEGQQGSNR